MPTGHVEIQLGVGQVGLVLALVHGQAGGTQDGAGVAPVQRVLGRHLGHVARAADEDAVAVQHAVDAGHVLFGEDQDFFQPFEPAVGQVARQAADAHVRIGQPRAGEVVQVLEDVVAHRHQVQEGGHAAHFHHRSGHAGHVVGDAVVLGQQRAQHDAARRELDAQQLLHGIGIGEVVVQRRAVVEPVRVRNDVVVGVVLGSFSKPRCR
jgi:hypothetical protein